jgi:hypothetical protein
VRWESPLVEEERYRVEKDCDKRQQQQQPPPQQQQQQQ